jgi:putative SOS response-associated peptidase YedK
MCGRYTVRNIERIRETFRPTQTEFAWDRPRYNVAPTQVVPAIVSREGATVLTGLRWGLVPSWAKDAEIGNRLINARAETVAQKASFRAAFKRRRCLIPADGFYEWKKLGRQKQPMYIRVDGGEPFAFAGLHEHWTGPDGGELATCAIITTKPNALMKSIHDRMPVILPAGAYARWLDPEFEDEDGLREMLQPLDAKRMDAYPVSRHVNSPRNDDARCVEPVE